MRSGIHVRFLLACLLTLLSAACVYRPAPLFDETSLLKADPAGLMFAEQSNAVGGGYSLEWMATLKDGALLSEGRAELARVATGSKPGFGLPLARAGQAWSVWTLDDAGREALRRLQEDVANAKAAGRAGSLSFGWKAERMHGLPVPDVLYLTHAVRLSDDGTWFTLFDNMAVIADEADAPRTD